MRIESKPRLILKIKIGTKTIIFTIRNYDIGEKYNDLKLSTQFFIVLLKTH
jgi:hypothetical protein